MRLIDTHAHLFVEQFDNDRSQIIQNAISKEVERIYLPNIDLSTIERLNQVLLDYPDICFGMMGLHPCSVKDNYQEELDQIKKEFETTKYCAVGEIGIDLYWDKTTLDIQADALRIQIGWAKEMDLPIVLHCRDSFEQVVKVVSEENDGQLKGIFHCFTGSVNDANSVIEMGFKIGIGGVATFKNGGLDQVLPHIDLSNIVLETDAPYLSPVPFRGKRNESAYLIHVLDRLSQFYQSSMEEIAEITTQNALEVFGQ
jgi:TatD DNase family protein